MWFGARIKSQRLIVARFESHRVRSLPGLPLGVPLAPSMAISHEKNAVVQIRSISCNPEIIALWTGRGCVA